ncbi:STAS domain-containing protein [Pseudonocardia acaciae]|uniref:STAS domain-containing protein n=1 Tax=Pseudonocardia acaciae TaxID=551276 RepID=UPI0006842815|nr:STAS domain-containing protein [Pseudonocardia acaciae]
MIINRRDAGRAAVFSVSGELDMLTTPKLDEALSGENGDRPVVLDLSGVTFIGSSGLAVVAEHANRVPARPDWLTVVTGDGHVVRAFNLSSLDTVVALYETVEDALADR